VQGPAQRGVVEQQRGHRPTRRLVVGQLGGGDQLAAHAVACARDRAWPRVTAAADRYVEFSGLVEVEPLP
jgi:hypothetical protein